MHKRLWDHSLSIVMFSLFGLCLLGHSLAGYAASRNDRQAPPATRPPLYGLCHEQPFVGLSL